MTSQDKIGATGCAKTESTWDQGSLLACHVPPITILLSRWKHPANRSRLEITCILVCQFRSPEPLVTHVDELYTYTSKSIGLSFYVSCDEHVFVFKLLAFTLFNIVILNGVVIFIKQNQRRTVSVRIRNKLLHTPWSRSCAWNVWMRFSHQWSLLSLNFINIKTDTDTVSGFYKSYLFSVDQWIRSSPCTSLKSFEIVQYICGS